MEEILDGDTLQSAIIQEWSRVAGLVETRQKLVSINVGDLWPGQEYHVPESMIVPATGKARVLSYWRARGFSFATHISWLGT